MIKESGNSIPILVIKPELFDFQVKEIDEAVMTNGQNPNGSEIPKTATIRVFNLPTQHAISTENERISKARIRVTRKKKKHTHTQPMTGTNYVGGKEKGSCSSGVTKQREVGFWG